MPSKDGSVSHLSSTRCELHIERHSHPQEVLPSKEDFIHFGCNVSQTAEGRHHPRSEVCGPAELIPYSCDLLGGTSPGGQVSAFDPWPVDVGTLLAVIMRFDTLTAIQHRQSALLPYKSGVSRDEGLAIIPVGEFEHFAPSLLVGTKGRTFRCWSR